MLLSVHIENIALIRSLNLDFSSGFSAFTGETGAGKSIVIDAIGMACGAKTSKEMIRDGADEARVEALFGNLSAQALDSCAALGIEPDEDGCLYIRRAMTVDGKNTVSVNGKRIPLSLLREIAPLLINIHGQHDNAELLRPETHRSILDAYAQDEKALSAYTEIYASYRAIEKEIAALTMDEMEKRRETDILKFQIEEIKSAKLKEGETEKLTAEKNKLRYREKINKNAAACCQSLYGTETGKSAVDSIERASASLKALDGIVPEAAELLERLENAKYELIDIAETAEGFCDGQSGDPTRALDAIEARLFKIGRLCSRYGADIAAVLAYCAECERRLEEIELSDEKVAALEEEKKKTEAALIGAAETLHAAREAASVRLSAEIERELSYLDMKSAGFCVALEPLGETPAEYGADGADRIEFLIRTNGGEGFHPLSKTASGGELSRIMLAIKSVLSDRDGVETLIFDEIDTGISGSTSRKIGVKLKKLAAKKQVLCVTHSAQIASLADNHYKISKRTEDDSENAENAGEVRTVTEAALLGYDARVREVARIISGIDVTDAALNSAKELMNGENDPEC